MAHRISPSVTAESTRVEPYTELQQFALRRPNYKTEDLSNAQQVALIQLAEGRSIAQTARMAQVHRTTLHRWIRSDPHFQAAFNAWQDEVRTSARARLLTLCDLAIDTVQEALGNRDAKTAVTVLRAMGVLCPSEEAPTNAEDIEKKMQLAERQRRLDLKRAEQQLDESEEVSSVHKLLADKREGSEDKKSPKGTRSRAPAAGSQSALP